MLSLTVLTSITIPRGFNVSLPVANFSNLFSSAKEKFFKVKLPCPKIHYCSAKYTVCEHSFVT